MARRSMAFVIALFVALAPAALIACELACAAADTAPASHACHETPAEASGATLVASPHVCGHVADLPSAKTERTAATAPAYAPAIVTAALMFAAGADAPHVANAPPRPPDRFSLTTPLRI